MSMQTHSEPRTTPLASVATIETKLEVVVLPVSDVDRAERFYQSLGWRLDADFAAGADRVVQLTPPGSPCSIIFGKGIATAASPIQNLVLVVSDIEAARADLIRRGAAVTEVRHDGVFQHTGTKGLDPEGRSYRNWASFRDPDGNEWVLQEIKTRLPGRGFSPDIATLTETLREAEQRHGQYEATAPKHHWSDWYAAFIVARERGRTPEEAANDAALYMKAAPQ